MHDLTKNIEFHNKKNEHIRAELTELKTDLLKYFVRLTVERFELKQHFSSFTINYFSTNFNLTLKIKN